MRFTTALYIPVGLLLMSALGYNANAQRAPSKNPSLMLRDPPVEVRLGMSESSLAQALKPWNAELRDDGLGSGWLIVVKREADQLVSSGDMVRLAKGRLIEASAQWTPLIRLGRQQQSGVDVAEALYGAFSSLAATDASCYIYTKQFPPKPGRDVKQVDVDCPGSGRSVSILSSSLAERGQAVSVTETIYSPR